MPDVSPVLRLRRLVALFQLFTFGAAGVSGVALFLRPEGSIARWVGWSALGFDKKQWEAVHIAFVAAFLLASLAHIAYNWRPLWTYLRPRGAASSRSLAGRLVPSLELTAAVVLAALVGFGAVGPRNPVTPLLQLRTDIKDGRFVVVAPPPAPDADRMTVAEVCRLVSASEDQVVGNARRRGIVIADTSATIGSIARKHRVSPQEVYDAMRGPGDGARARP